MGERETGEVGSMGGSGVGNPVWDGTSVSAKPQGEKEWVL